IQLRKHIGSGSACVQDVHRECALPENDSGCAPTARLSAESSDIYSRSTPPSNFEIGSSHTVVELAVQPGAGLVGLEMEGESLGGLTAEPFSFIVPCWMAATVGIAEICDCLREDLDLSRRRL